MRPARRPKRLVKFDEKNIKLLYDTTQYVGSFSVGDCVRIDYAKVAPFGYVPESCPDRIYNPNPCYILGFAEMEAQGVSRVVGAFVILAQLYWAWEDGIVDTERRYYCGIVTAGKILDPKYPDKVLLFPLTCLSSSISIWS